MRDFVTSEELKGINNVDQLCASRPDGSYIPLEVFIEVPGKIFHEFGLTIPLYKSPCPGGRMMFFHLISRQVTESCPKADHAST